MATADLLYANPAASDLLGIPLRERTGRPLLPLLAPVAPELTDVLTRTVRESLPRSRAEGVIHRDGRQVLVGLTTTFAERDGVGRTATAIFQDISDSKRLQALHVRTERLQAVAELSASLAHEIKNPLASIRSATEQLARRHARRSDGDDDERALFALTVREADRLSRLLSEFLDFARTRAPNLAPVHVAAVARAAVALIAHHPDRADGVQLALMCDLPDEATRIDGDEDLLHRALSNLILNAVQAVGANGSVRVHVTTTAAPDDTGRVVLLHVDDDGPGIADEVRDRLFEPFVTSKPGGSGLGLAVVHRAVEAHRGTVQVEPLARGADRHPHARGRRASARGRPRARPDLPVILMTAQATLQSAMQAVNEGAFYYIQKPFRNDELLAILRRAAEHRRCGREHVAQAGDPAPRPATGGWRPVGAAAPGRTCCVSPKTVAPTDSTVLIRASPAPARK
jgi:two-component system, NtrC family, sensor histidine kinase PilS